MQEQELFEKAASGEFSHTQILFILLLSWAAQLIVWGAKQVWIWFQKRSIPNLHDIKVYEKHKTTFSQPLVDFLRTHTFANPYPRAILDSVDEAFYYDRFKTPDFLFHNSDLEGKRLAMISALETFWSDLGRETFALDGNLELSNVPIRDNDPLQDRRDEIIVKLNKGATLFIKSFDEFCSSCNKHFDKKAA